ncbi:hypothetical protein BKA57DRAFT_325167 [Linnemannia elongata]|nr:hypothetical protein BKA57DRAFT_325167 [Linnemannia elongata]
MPSFSSFLFILLSFLLFSLFSSFLSPSLFFPRFFFSSILLHFTPFSFSLPSHVLPPLSSPNHTPNSTLSHTHAHITIQAHSYFFLPYLLVFLLTLFLILPLPLLSLSSSRPHSSHLQYPPNFILFLAFLALLPPLRFPKHTPQQKLGIRKHHLP